MMPMPEFLSRFVHRVAHATGSSTRRAIRAACMRIVMFHGVGDRSFSTEDFERVLRYLAKHFEIVSLAEIERRTHSRLRLQGRELALTFDDGLRNNATVAYPLLREMELPATFFLCPGLIDSGRWLWNHEARARLESLADAALPALRESLGMEAPPRGSNAVEAVVEAMKALGPAERERAEEAVRRATPGFQPQPVHRRHYDLMSWEEVRGLDPALIGIGSHTFTHPILTTLDDEGLDHEIRGSRQRLERILGREVAHFCYPNGAEDPRVRAVVADAYEVAVTTRPGTIGVGADVHRLPRIAVSDTPATMAWRLTRH